MLYLKHKDNSIYSINISGEEDVLFNELNKDLSDLLVNQNLNKKRTEYIYGQHKNFQQFIFEAKLEDSDDINSIKSSLLLYTNGQNPMGNADNNYTFEDIKLLIFRYNDTSDQNVNHRVYLCTQAANHKTLAKIALKKSTENGKAIPFDKTDNTTIVIKDLFDEIIEITENHDGKKEYKILFYKPKKAGNICSLKAIPQHIYKKHEFIEKIKNNGELISYLNEASLSNIKVKNNTQNLNIFIKFNKNKIIQAINMINQENKYISFRKYIDNNKLSLPSAEEEFKSLLGIITETISILDNYPNTLEKKLN